MKKVLWILVAVLVITLGVFGFLIFSDLFQETKENVADKVEGVSTENENKEKKNENKLQENREKVSGTITAEDLLQFKEEGLNPFGEQTKSSELTSSEYNEYIHGMSHQKIKAEKKWGFYEIHPERIKWLLDGLEKVEIENEDTYREILQKWNDGDFASIDQDHNTIWGIQGGTVGKATGILSVKEEREYINKNN